MMKLYTADLSPYSARVRMQIYAKGITDIVFELPEHWGMPKFREKFPIGRVPVLDIDGDLIPESEVIAEYLEEIYPEPSLLGTTPRETAHIRTLARLGDIYIINNTFMLSRQTGALSRRTPAAARDNCCQRPARRRGGAEPQGARQIHRHGWLRLLRPHHTGGLRARAWTLLGRERPAGRRRRDADSGTLQMSLPIGLQSRKTSMRQKC